MSAVLTLLMTAGRNIITSLLTKTFGVWLLKQAAKSTKTTVDDNAVALLEAGLNNDTDEIVKNAKALIENIEKEIKD